MVFGHRGLGTIPRKPAHALHTPRYHPAMFSSSTDLETKASMVPKQDATTHPWQ